MTDNSIKTYYFPPVRSIISGIIIALFAIGLSLIGLDTNLNFWDNFQSMVLDFRGVINFIGSLILLMVKIGLFALAFNYLSKPRKIARARIDAKGLYYKGNVKSRYEFLTHEWEDLKFISFADMQDITCTKSFWLGEQIQVSTSKGQETLVSLGVLKSNEKLEIVETVRSKIGRK